MRYYLILAALLAICSPQTFGAVECATLSTSGWEQDRINHRAANAIVLHGNATGLNTSPVITGDQICFPGTTGDVPAIITEQAMLDQYNAMLAQQAADTAAYAAFIADLEADVSSNPTCEELADPTTNPQLIDQYYEGRFPTSITTVAALRDRTKMEFIRLARCVRATLGLR